MVDKHATAMRRWEPVAVFLVSLMAFAFLAPRVTTYLDPTTGDEPFYLMTAISMWQDQDLNECNNYRELDETVLYPDFYTSNEGWFAGFPPGWKGWGGSPFPLPPHPARITPANRRCISTNPFVALPTNGTRNELYSKHGLGMSLLILPAYVLGDRMLVVLFLNVLAALLAMNVYMLAREATQRAGPAVMTWLAFTFTIPFLPYSFLIFPELPAALLVVYAFRRIRLWQNNRFQAAAVGLSMAFLPWLHYRFVPVTAGLLLFYLYQEFRHRTRYRYADLAVVLGQLTVSAGLMMAFFYHRYRQITPNAEDHAGSSDFAGTLRGIAGLFYDQQWGLFIAAPIFVLSLVGIALMAGQRARRKDLLWIGVIALPYFLVVANYAQWWGEWCPPARYLASTLPLMALPFAVSLQHIKSAAYEGIYAFLLVLSLSMTAGFLYQPQWMYHQPDGRNQVFTRAVPQLLSNTPFADDRLVVAAKLTSMAPSFVRPYFEYTYYSRSRGDAASKAAWKTGTGLFVATFGIVIWSLVLAWAPWTRRWGRQAEDSPGEDYAEVPESDSPGVVADLMPSTAPSQQDLVIAPGAQSIEGLPPTDDETYTVQKSGLDASH